MATDLKRITEASKDLVFISESDHPFQPVHITTPPENMADELRKLAGAEKDALVEKQTLEYFFRNATNVFPGSTPEDAKTAIGYQQLAKVLHEELTDIVVYRVGIIQVHAFIIGKLKDGSYGGLRTLLIET